MKSFKNFNRKKKVGFLKCPPFIFASFEAPKDGECAVRHSIRLLSSTGLRMFGNDALTEDEVIAIIFKYPHLYDTHIFNPTERMIHAYQLATL